MKRLTAQNWLEPDVTGAPSGSDPLAWRDAFLSIRMDPRVPDEVSAMFEAARASVVYGLFYAPLVTLGVEHCYWVLEAGMRARCAQLDLPTSVQDKQGREHTLSFSHNLRQLVDRDVIDLDDAELWKQAVELREWATSPKQGSSINLEHVVTAFTRAAALLNRLFT